jgi:hypothetical protein
MAETTPNQGAQIASDLAAAARDRGVEQLEGAKGQLAEGVERIASAVDRTSDDLEGEGDSGLSGFGHSVANLMRQLAGGLRERDVEAFARELGALARRNPGVFLAGSVAVGFGIARFFKARSPQSEMQRDGRWQDGGWQQSPGEPRLGARDDFDADDSLDLSASAMQHGEQDRHAGGAGSSGGELKGGGASSTQTGSSYTQTGSSYAQTGSQDYTQTGSQDDALSASKPRQSGKQHKSKSQRPGSGGGSAQASASGRDASTDWPASGGGTTGSGSTTGTGTSTSGGTGSHGGKS